jgi:signal transduction histidine kinase
VQICSTLSDIIFIQKCENRLIEEYNEQWQRGTKGMDFSAVIKKAPQSSRLMSMFGILMAINYPLYYFIWLYNGPVEYSGVGLRIVATVLCLALLFRKYWPSQLSKWLPIYWYGTVTYCLPFFFVYMTLKNHGDVVWILNVLTVLFFTLIMFDFFTALIVLAVGCIFACSSFLVMGGQFMFVPGTITPLGVGATFFAAIVIGSVFSRIRGITEEERLRWEEEQHETELLRLENEHQQVALREKEKLIALAHKVAHDISSPLSALDMIVYVCDELPEQKRTQLRRATKSILDIANNLLTTYRNEENRLISNIEPCQSLLVSDLLVQLLGEKKFQYLQCPVTFKTVFADDVHSAFISMQNTEFRRMMSNLINNAVDALEGKKNGKITIQLTADANSVIIEVQDNGKGMARDKVEKMLEQQNFTDGKENGHGLGLRQVWDTLICNHGAMNVQSTLGEGTVIQLIFPRVAAPG